ncbi:MAG TPA: alpha/beta fold hydrolase [Thermoplasmata archaeon]|nr:alpha/beta fold hydrolase [Thermoplasmata archaeon]
MGTARNRGISIHFEVEGHGPALLLHTGAGGDLRIWRDAGYVAGLSGFRTILMDQRGRGESDRPTHVEDHAMERYAEDVGAVLDEAGVDTAGFWGYSNGFHVGLAFGAMFPNRLRALVGTGAASFLDLDGLPPIPDPVKFMEEVVARGGVRADVDAFERREADRFPDPIDRNVRATDPYQGALRIVAWRGWNGPRSRLGSTRAPVLLVVGEKEDLDGSSDQVARALPDGRKVQVPGVGHLGAFYRSDLALPIALPFLRDHLG